MLFYRVACSLEPSAINLRISLSLSNFSQGFQRTVLLNKTTLLESIRVWSGSYKFQRSRGLKFVMPLGHLAQKIPTAYSFDCCSYDGFFYCCLLFLKTFKLSVAIFLHYVHYQSFCLHLSYLRHFIHYHMGAHSFVLSFVLVCEMYYCGRAYYLLYYYLDSSHQMTTVKYRRLWLLKLNIFVDDELLQRGRSKSTSSPQLD